MHLKKHLLWCVLKYIVLESVILLFIFLFASELNMVGVLVKCFIIRGLLINIMKFIMYVNEE